MDRNVVDAQIRWPNVPAAFGWLSLDPRGQWRLHEGGASEAGGPGASITNQQIVGFINRNYCHDDEGRWFFQNGPQRVYVRVDAAPLILHADATGSAFLTHTGVAAGRIEAWWLDDAGRLFAHTSTGPAMVIDRDLIGVLDAMSVSGANGTGTDVGTRTDGDTVEDVGTADSKRPPHPAGRTNAATARHMQAPSQAPTPGSEPLLTALASLGPGQHMLVAHPSTAEPVVLTMTNRQDIPAALGFIAAPKLG